MGLMACLPRLQLELRPSYAPACPFPGPRSDLEFMEIDFLVRALQPAGIPYLLLNKFLTLGRKQAAAAAAGGGGSSGGAAAQAGNAVAGRQQQQAQ